MKMPFGLSAFAGAFALCATNAVAGDLFAGQGRTIELAGVHGVAYYTVSGDRYDVVATLVSDAGQPVRVSAQLNDGQAMTLLVPTALKSGTAAVDIRRVGTDVFVIPKTPAIN